jgi:hypothetical protein
MGNNITHFAISLNWSRPLHSILEDVAEKYERKEGKNNLIQCFILYTK